MRLLHRPRLALFAFGDFAFNLYWQSIMLFLLFYYTDTLNIPIGIAATTYLVASVWDGIANFTAGVLVDRGHDRFRYGALLVAGSVPLGLTFILTYLPPLASGAWAAIWVLGAHLLFRTAYAGVNVPYLAMSARISAEPSDRAFIAGLRMLFGTAAVVVVALCTVPVGRWLTGTDAARAYFGAAALFATIGTVILIVVGMTYDESAEIHRPTPASLKAALLSLAGNRAFVALNAAMMAMIVAVTVLNKSVLYYFKYLLGDPDAGQLALAAIGLVSAIAIPCWMLIGRRVGLAGTVAPIRKPRHGRIAFLHARSLRRGSSDAAVPRGDAGHERRPELRLLGDASEHDRIWRAGDRAPRRRNGVRCGSAAATDRNWNCYGDPWLGI